MDYRTVRAKAKRPTDRQIKAAKLLSDPNRTITSAMIEAGYTATTASQGYAAVPATVLALMPRETNFVELGRALTAEQQESLVRGRLVLNVIRGKDAGVNSAYRLGQDKRISMFTSENQVGIIVVNAPPGAGVLEELPKEEK